MNSSPPPDMGTAAPGKEAAASTNDQQAQDVISSASAQTKKPLDPLIPSWLDDAGLTANEFRVLAHIWRRGEVFSSAGTIAKTCRLKRDTVFEILATLNDAGFIRRTSRPGMTTLIEPVPIGGTGGNNNPSRLGGQVASRLGGQDPSRFGGHKGNTIKDTPLRTSRKSRKHREPSLEGKQFASWFKGQIPSQNIPQKDWHSLWGNTYDELVQKDKRPPEEIRAVCLWGRNDDWWKKNFHAPTKLRKRNKDGVLYYDVFRERMASTSKPSTSTPDTGYRSEPEYI